MGSSRIVNIPMGNTLIKLNVRRFGKKDDQLGLNSGPPFGKTQFLFLDYDDFDPIDECVHILHEYQLKRGIIVETSPERWGFYSFSPMPAGCVAEILYHSSCDKGHACQFMKFGYNAIRITPKEHKGYPRINDTARNANGTNFYNFYAENIYKKLIENNHLIQSKMRSSGISVSKILKRFFRDRRDPEDVY